MFSSKLNLIGKKITLIFNLINFYSPIAYKFLNTFILSKLFVVNLLASFVPKFFKISVWINPKPFFEYFTVYYLRRSMKKEKIIFINKVYI